MDLRPELLDIYHCIWCDDMCIIRFHAGPPYEDIAFKIANREWDMTERAGFKNLFDRGILRLYFFWNVLLCIFYPNH